jgi:hypothetical protein
MRTIRLEGVQGGDSAGDALRGLSVRCKPGTIHYTHLPGTGGDRVNEDALDVVLVVQRRVACVFVHFLSNDTACCEAHALVDI